MNSGEKRTGLTTGRDLVPLTATPRIPGMVLIAEIPDQLSVCPLIVTKKLSCLMKVLGCSYLNILKVLSLSQ